MEKNNSRSDAVTVGWLFAAALYGIPKRFPEGPEFAEVPWRLKRDIFANERVGAQFLRGKL
jgi:hypothetical protein